MSKKREARLYTSYSLLVTHYFSFTQLAEVDNFHIPELAVVDIKANAGTVNLEALFAGGPRINKQHPVFLLVPANFQDVGMSAYKDIGRIILHLFPDGYAIPAQGAPNMCHPDVDTVPVKPLVQRVLLAYILTVDVSVYANDRGDLLQF